MYEKQAGNGLREDDPDFAANQRRKTQAGRLRNPARLNMPVKESILYERMESNRTQRPCLLCSAVCSDLRRREGYLPCVGVNHAYEQKTKVDDILDSACAGEQHIVHRYRRFEMAHSPAKRHVFRLSAGCTPATSYSRLITSLAPTYSRPKTFPPATIPNLTSLSL